MWRPSRPGVIAAVLLVLMAVLSGGAALRESATVDEVAHIAAGVSYWQKFDLRLNPEHPPLAKLLSALPLIVRGTRADYSSLPWTGSEQPFSAFLGEWVFGDWLLYRWNEAAKVLAWARLPMLLLTLVLGWVVYRLGRQLGGAWGGLLCLAVYCSMPFLLAFGAIVHTDVAITLFSILTIWTFADLYREPSASRKWRFAFAFAGALLSKFTAGLLLPVMGGFLVSARWMPLSGQPEEREALRRWRRVRLRALLGGILWASVFVYGVYLVFSWNQPTWVLDHLRGGVAMVPVRRLLMPIWEYLLGLALVVMGSNRPTFLLGHWYPHGVWFYFPVATVLKCPLGFLALLVLAPVGWVLHRHERNESDEKAIPAERAVHWRALWVSLLVLTAACMLSRMTISIRHFSVPLVLAILLLAPLPNMIGRIHDRRVQRGLAITTAGAVASCILAALFAYPYYFPFTNLLSAGRPAFTLLSDSNVDWNQSLPEVGRYAERRGLQEVPIDFYGFTDPKLVVPHARVWNCQLPEQSDAGHVVVVSANLILDSHNCSWLMNFPRDEIAGGSMYAIHLPSKIPLAGMPGGPPVPADFRQLGGIPNELDMRAEFMGVSEHPDRMQQVLAKFQKAFQDVRAQQSGKKK